MVYVPDRWLSFSAWRVSLEADVRLSEGKRRKQNSLIPIMLSLGLLDG